MAFQHLISLIWLFIQRVIQDNNKEIIKAVQYWPCMLVMHWWTGGVPAQMASNMEKFVHVMTKPKQD